MFYRPGNLVFKGGYEAGARTGEWDFLRDRKLIARVYYKGALRNGQCVSYFPEGKIKSIDTYLEGERHGESISYYKNGKKRTEMEYRNDTIVNAVKTYYRNGNAKLVIDYKNGRPYNIRTYLDSAGHSLDKGSLTNGSGLLKLYFDSDPGQISMEREYENSLEHGRFVMYHSNGKKSREGRTENGYRIGLWKEYNEKGDSIGGQNYRASQKMQVHFNYFFEDVNSDDVFTIVEQMPAFPGGEVGLMQLIRGNIHYPNDARSSGISGTVYVSFVISNIGEVTEAKILRGVNASLDMEALRVIRLMPGWVPGFQNGTPVSVQYNIPIKYTLK